MSDIPSPHTDTRTQGQKPHLFVFGPGYSATGVMDRALEAGWTVSATWRRPEARDALEKQGITPVRMEDGHFNPSSLAPVSHILTTIAPERTGAGDDPVLRIAGDWLKSLTGPGWIGYLSSTNVYGDHAGAWVDETSTLKPHLDRGKRRLKAEHAWRGLADSLAARLHVFRLAGIYGPGRNAVKSLMAGTARRIIKENQVFSRIHVSDIEQALWAGMTSTAGHDIFNMADDKPLPPQTVIEMAAEALGMVPPPAIPFEQADLSPMARSFYTESKRVKNIRVKDVLGIRLRYPTFESALDELVAAEKQAAGKAG